MADMLLRRYLDRLEYGSYEDFKENYRINVPESFNFAYDVVDAWAEAEPGKEALVWCDDVSGERRFTFGEVSSESRRIANFLEANGIGRGDAVMLMLRKRYEYWLCAVALHRVGAVCVPASVQLTEKDIAYRVRAAEIRMVIAIDDGYVVGQTEAAAEALDAEGGRGPAFAKVLVGGRREGWVSLDDGLALHSDAYERRYVNSSLDTMIIYFSSGTTGMPKMVRHDHSHPLGHITTARYWQRVEEGRLHFTDNDSGWAKFGWGRIYGQWLCGAVIFAYDYDRFVPGDVLRKLEEYKVTTFCASPTIYRFFIKEDLTRYDLSSVRRCATAGEPLNPEVFSQFKKATGLEIKEGFGQTETTVLLANFEWFPTKPGSMGKPSPLYDIALLDSEGNACEEGVEGVIAVRGLDGAKVPGLFTEYHKDEALTRELWKDGTYYTGDMAWMDGDGYYWFVGRNDDVIKCSGYRIGPFEVESALLTHPAVLECAITAAPDKVRGQVVAAFVVTAKGYEGSDALARELQDHVKKVTAPYKYPRIVRFVGELPKTIGGGKIKRALLKEELGREMGG